MLRTPDLGRDERAAFPVYISAKTSSGGRWIYTWIEQADSPVGYADAAPARLGDSSRNQLFEVNNTEVSVPCYARAWIRSGQGGTGLCYEFSAGSTATVTGTVIIDGVTYNVINNSSFNVSSGKTLTLAGPGTVAITAPATVSGSFTISAPTTYSWADYSISNGNNTLDFANITKALMRLTGPSAEWAFNAITGAFVDGFRFTLVNLTGQIGKLTGSGFALIGGLTDYYIPTNGGVDLVYRNSLSKLAIDTSTAPYAITAADLGATKSTDIASSGTTDLSTATGDYLHVTGTTTITALGTMAAGAERSVVFDGALTLTHNATSLILPTGANITTAAGDTAIFRSEGSGNVRCLMYQRKDGTALAAGSGLTVGTTTIASGTNGRLLYDNSAVLGEATIGSGLSLSAGTLTATAAVTVQTAVVSSDQSGITSTTYIDITALTFSVAASKIYHFEAEVMVTTDASTTGFDVAVNGPSSPTTVIYEQRYRNVNTTATAYDNDTANTSSGGTTPWIFRCVGALVNGSNAGSLTFRVKVESGSGGTIAVKAGSSARLWTLN